MMAKPVYIVGVRGMPNRYGGFERLVEVLAPHLAKSGRPVTVFCEGDETTPDQDWWNGVERRFIKRRHTGVAGTIRYDLQAFRLVPRGAIVLVFGYGTALFQAILRARNIPHCVNMDGIEWQREKWGWAARAWLRLNERIAARSSDMLIADHPEIQRDLYERFGVRASMIAYGVEASPPMAHLGAGHFSSGRRYVLVVARPEPENQIHIILGAYRRAQTDVAMLVVGGFDATEYGKALVLKYPEVNFIGPLYDSPTLNELRRDAELYIHGHRVGGTNPSLIEAMAAQAIIVAHDNVFNRWVLGGGGRYFTDERSLAEHLRRPPSTEARIAFRTQCRLRCATDFLWPHILNSYDAIVAQLEAER